MSGGIQTISLSVIIPVTERFDDPKVLYQGYKKALSALGLSYEIIYVLDGPFPIVQNALLELKQQGESIRIIKLAKWFGEAAALTIGFEHSRGQQILTLPAYYQIEATEIPNIIKALATHDLVVARRWPRLDSLINRIQSGIFHRLLNIITKSYFHDLGCGVRAFKRKVMDEINIYGDQHRFFSLLAYQKGFKVHELNVKQASQDMRTRVYRPGVYLRRVLDLLTVFFLVKFTKKPLRFFGLVGSLMFAAGLVITLYLIVERLFISIPLADRPALLLSSLLVVLGIQIFAIGLIGEIIIFTHAREIKEYTVEEIIN